MIDGSGSGYGYGYGYGYGSGYGYGYGYGDGYGYGYGERLGCIADYDVVLYRSWNYVAVGCHCRPIEWWRTNWRRVAKKEDVVISESEVEGLLCKALSCAVEPMGGASSSVSTNRNP